MKRIRILPPVKNSPNDRESLGPKAPRSGGFRAAGNGDKIWPKETKMKRREWTAKQKLQIVLDGLKKQMLVGDFWSKYSMKPGKYPSLT